MNLHDCSVGLVTLTLVLYYIILDVHLTKQRFAWLIFFVGYGVLGIWQSWFILAGALLMGVERWLSLQQFRIRYRYAFVLLASLIVGLYAASIEARLPISWIHTTLWLLLIGLVMQPVNWALGYFFDQYHPDEPISESAIDGAGAMIGILERLIMVLLMAQGQFAAIGLVFTAKSIARYNKLAENSAFAEYYLIGSLFSLLATLSLYYLVEQLRFILGA